MNPVLGQKPDNDDSAPPEPIAFKLTVSAAGRMLFIHTMYMHMHLAAHSVRALEMGSDL